MYSVAAKVQEMDYYTRLNKEFRSDLYWWHTFVNQLERDQLPRGGAGRSCPTGDHPNRRIWHVGVWGIFRGKVATMAMDGRVATHTDNGKRDGAYSFKLHSVGGSASP